MRKTILFKKVMHGNDYHFSSDGGDEHDVGCIYNAKNDVDDGDDHEAGSEML